MLKGVLAGPARHAIPQYRRFEAEARSDGARFIEAEHMLLAIAADADDQAGKLLVEAGLDHERLATALRDERRESLAFAGMKPLAQGSVQMREADRTVFLGTSAKAALKRALHEHHRERAARRGRIGSRDLLIGILQAELGTVPRALSLAGVDRDALVARARAGVAQPC